MTTIANAFLDDYDEDIINEKLKNSSSISIPKVQNNSVDSDKKSITQNEYNEKEINKLSEIYNSKQLNDLLKIIEELISTEPTHAYFNSLKDSLKENLEYDTIVKSNKILRKIEDDTISMHKFIKEIYRKRFPELEQTIVDPVKYTKIIKLVGNEIDSLPKVLDNLVTDHQKLSTMISASATSGKPLSDLELKKVIRACEIVQELDLISKKILNYIDSRMIYIAPNLSTLLGTSIASSLIGLSGGMYALSKIPSCNLQSLGSSKLAKNETPFIVNPYIGLISKSEIVSEYCPPEFHKKILRVLSSKVSLAARIDYYQKVASNKIGKKYLQEIKKKIDKWLEAPPPKPDKPLPLPLNKPKSKRGGKRYRKMKEKYKVTELQRMKNRMGFNVAQDTNEEGEEFGMIGKTGIGGKLRIIGNETNKLKKLEKINKVNIAKERKKRSRLKALGLVTNDGMATSVVMNEVQGMSFINPENVDKEEGDGDGTKSYFDGRAV